MFSIRTRLFGEKSLNAALEGVKDGVKNRVIKNATAKLARTGGKRAKEFAPRGATRLLKKSIGVKYASYQNRRVWVYVIGPRYGFDQYGRDGVKHDPVRTAHLAERGRKAVRITKKKAMFLSSLGGVFRESARAASGSRFMAKTLRVVKAGRGGLKSEILKGIEAEARKYRRKGKTIYLGGGR